MKTVYKSSGLIIPVEGSSTLQALRPGTRQALADLTRTLNQSHQLIAQRLGKLSRLGLIKRSSDPEDKRRSEYVLTDLGVEQWRLLDSVMRETVAINDQLFEEVGVDLTMALDKAISILGERGLDSRFSTFKPKGSAP